MQWDLWWASGGISAEKFFENKLLVVSPIQMAHFYQADIPYAVFYGLWVSCHQLLFSLKTWLIRIFKGTSLFTTLLLLDFCLAHTMGSKLPDVKCEIGARKCTVGTNRPLCHNSTVLG